MEFGEYLKNRREELKLSIRQLAMYSKVSASYISQIETGERNKPKPEILQKLAKPLKVEYEELMERAGYLVEKEKTETNYFDSIAELNKLVEKYGIEQMGFFDIEQWKKFTPEHIEEIKRHFEWVAHKANELSKEKD